MPKHLYTIPSGTALPTDITGLPEGSPFLLLTGDETVAGHLYVLQGVAFVEVASSAVPVVTATRTPATFTCVIPATAVAGAEQVVAAGYAGVALAPFVVPAGLTGALGQIREVTATLSDGSAPAGAVTATVELNGEAFAPIAPVVLDSTHAQQVVTTTYDDTISANQLATGALVTVNVVVAAGFTSSADVTLVVTLFFGEKEQTGAMLGDEGPAMREARLVEREHDLGAAS